MTKTISVGSIDASNRLRPIDPDWVIALAASIEQSRLETPIVVRPQGEGYALICGGHRLAAMQALGMSELTIGEHILIRQQTNAEARLAEIDENLIRRELNPLDRALFLAERKRVWEEINPQVTHGGDRRSTRAQELRQKINAPNWRLDLPERFTADAAERTGLGERTIQRALTLAERLDANARELIRATPMAKSQSALLSLAEESPEDQRRIARLVASGQAGTLAQARIAAGLAHEAQRDAQTRIWSCFLSLWAKANTRTRKAIAEHVAAAVRGAA